MKKYILKLLLVALITGGFATGRYLYQDYKNNLKYCFAYHDMERLFKWYSYCNSDKKACDKEAANKFSVGYKINVEKDKNCYKYHEVKAWCLDDVRTNDFVKYDGDDVELTRTVCTKTEAECSNLRKYQLEGNFVKPCYEKVVSEHEDNNAYLFSQSELEYFINVHDLAKKYKTNSGKETVKQQTKANNSGNKSGCTKYESAPNQQSAFENLGLNWKKTKNWGAFVDIDGNLRANKPSCRLIERGSTEYNKYK